jgi:predicted dehydrogenase
MIDWVLNLVHSDVETVTGSFVAGVWEGAKSEDHTRASIQFANGCTADFEVSQLKSVGKPKWRILGTRGGITADWGPTITISEWTGTELVTAEVECGEDEWGAYYKNFNSFLQGNEELAVKPEQARRTIAVIEAAEESYRIGRAVSPAYK